MVTINLLPWRVYRKKYEDKQTNIWIVSSIVVSLLLLVMTHCFMSYQEHKRRMHVSALEQEWLRDGQRHSMQPDARVKRIKNLINNMRAYRFATKNLFAALGAASENNVCFTSIERTDGRVVFSGRTRSVTDLREFFKTWGAAYLFSTITIQELEEQPENQGIRFRFIAAEQRSLSREGPTQKNDQYAV